MSVTETDADSVPAVIGLNVTEIVQLAAAASEAPQVFEGIANEAALVPVRAMEEIVRAAVPVFFNVTVRAAEVVPMGVLGRELK